jgi:hypothetical protein
MNAADTKVKEIGEGYENISEWYCSKHSWQIFFDSECSKCSWEAKDKPKIEDLT